MGAYVLPKSRDTKLWTDGRLLPIEVVPIFVLSEAGDRIEVMSGHRIGELVKGEVLMPDAAITHFDELIRKNPQDAWAYLCHSMAYRHSNEEDRTEAEARDLKDAMRLEPKNALFFVHRAITWTGDDRETKGVADCDTAIRLDPRCAVAYYERALRSRGQKAAADFGEVLRLEPMNYSALDNRAQWWLDLDEYDKALADFDDLIRIEPKGCTHWCGRRIAWQYKREPDKAIADYSEAIRLNPTYRLAMLHRASGWHDKREYAQALRDVDAVLRIESKSPDACNLSAWIRATCPNAEFRNGRKAIAMAHNACEWSQWQHPPYLDTLAAAHAEAGEFDEAVKWQTKAIDILTARKEETAKYRRNLEFYEMRMPLREKVE
jgi:tetratricopeptide (TPR) repeat protein